MRTLRLIQNDRGVALITVLLVALVVGVFSVAAALIGTNSGLISRYQERQNTLEAIADAGIEAARSRINGDRTLYPASGYATLENAVSVNDASGAPITGVTRSLYVGPTGITTGQYGVFGSVVSVAEDVYGNRVVRRGEMQQESFAKYAYFTDFEPSTIRFGSGDQIFGPVHSNSPIRIYSTGATFWSEVTTAQNVVDPQYGVFAQGYQEFVDSIPMPQTADLVALRVQAQAGNTYFVGNTTGPVGAATTRIEFVAIDLDGDNQVNGSNEGFIRVYQCTNMNSATCAGWVVADRINTMTNSTNCGDVAGGVFLPAVLHAAVAPHNHTATVSLTSGGRRCYLGGSDSLWGTFDPVDASGQWRAWPGAVSPLVALRLDAGFLFPITRSLNPNFKGVIFVEGKVAISGVLRGRVTVAATDEIIIADDMTYATDPVAGTCNDMMGLFSGADVIISDNTINAPVSVGGTYRTYDDTPHEFVHGVVLALNVFQVDNFDVDPPGFDQNPEPCEGTRRGRGCLYLSGGIIQQQRGGIGTGSVAGAGAGNVKRYAYDQCAATDPPPYFPTTGVFARGRYYEINPVGFDVAALFASLTPAN
jgi:Tfp pilus assembly protein PilX